MEANFLILNIEGSYLYKDNWFKMDFNQFHIYIDGTIESSGSDIIGKFEIKGKLEQDRSINFIKQYIEQHSVEYKGKLIENQIKGLWSIGTNSNEFIIKIKIDKYNGWYEQFGVKTEQMAFFNINDERRIFGIGYDGIGISIWLGTINFDDEVFLNKQYIGQHSVGYKGIIKSEIIEGKWNISGCEDGDGFFEFKKEN